jgi:dephospho-CoA kinase
MRVIYVLGSSGAGKTTLISIAAYNLFLHNYQVGILDLTSQGLGYFFRFGACDFFALGDGSVEVPRRLKVTLQDIGYTMGESPIDCLNALPLMPGLKICLTSPGPRQEKLALAQLFLETYENTFDTVFVEMQPQLLLLRNDSTKRMDRVLVVCADAREDWPAQDRQLMEMCTMKPQQVKVLLNKQKENLAAATRFVQKNNLGVNYILPPAEDWLANSTVMEWCKQAAHSRFLKQLKMLLEEIEKE